MYDEQLIALVRRAIKSLDEWLFVGLGLNETEYRLARSAHDEQNVVALDFILKHSGWQRHMPDFKIRPKKAVDK